jgi:GMP synthase (glutamine-hydrolysing)
MPFLAKGFALGETTYGFQFHPECSLQNFRRWQDKCQSLYALSGSQTREEQDQFAGEAHSAQANWLEQFLDQLAGPA